MNKITIKKLKKELNISCWSEVKTKNQFDRMMAYMYLLDDKTNEEIVNSINNLKELIEAYFIDRIDLIIDYEPSIMVALADMNSSIMELFDKKGMKAKKMIPHKLKNLSQWLMADSKVECITKNHSLILTVAEVIDILMENKDEMTTEDFQIFLIKDKLESLPLDLRELIKYGIDFGEDPYLGRSFNLYDFYEIEDNEDNYYLN